jgi:hypothetical protein
LKRLLFVFVFVVFASWAFPAQLKIMAGASLSKSSAPLGGIYPLQVWEERVSQFEAGLSVGGGIEFPLYQTIALEVDVLFFQKGSRIEQRYGDEVIGHWIERMNELSFPVFLKIYLRPGSSPYLLGGGEVAFVLAKQSDPNNYGLVSQRTEYGLVFGAGYRKLIKGFYISIEGRYNHGLQDMVSDFSILRKMRVFSLLVGFSF